MNTKTVFTAIFVLLQFVSFSQVTYYFSTSGSDSNNGLTSGSPKQSLSALQTLIDNGSITPGTQIKFE